MEWQAEGLIIGTRRHGENAVIIETMTAEHGRHLGLVKCGRSRKYAALLQPGNSVQLVWRARLADHLGMFTVEAVKLRAASLMESRQRLALSQLLCEHMRLLPERDPHPRLYAEALAMHDNDADGETLARALAKFEMRLLNELGFGIDVSACAITGEEEGLCYVSPRTGRAVTKEAGEAYKDKLFALPEMLGGSLKMGPAEAIDAAFRLTGHFLHLHIWSPRQLSPPSMRQALIEGLVKAL